MQGEQEDTTTDHDTNKPERILIFGEVLYDCFPEGKRVLGGAPFNVAWHLKGLGEHPVFISRVGHDGDGRAIRRAMDDWQMVSGGLQIDESLATGEVTVSVLEGDARYEIHEPRAWDQIEDTGWSSRGILYHGSLALRSTENQKALAAIRERSGGARFLDLNLRPPFVDWPLIHRQIEGLDWLKLNLDELGQLAGRPAPDFADAVTMTARVRERYQIENILLTAGEQGCILDGSYGEARLSPAPVPEKMIDTVGAGDSFSAVAIFGILREWPAPRLLQTAASFAARVCGLNGATTFNKEIYEGLTDE
jgi:fructokinase